jgi:hypothetical protein
VQLGEAGLVARERTPLAGRAAPGLVRLHLEVDDGVAPERLAHGLRAERATAERHHARVGAPEQLEHHLLLARAEGGLALAVEEVLDRLAEPALELVVGVERLCVEPAGERPRCARLPGAHEADEHERTGPGGRRALARGGAGYRLHPIRSR